jgi:hypothetical protein
MQASLISVKCLLLRLLLLLLEALQPFPADFLGL